MKEQRRLVIAVPAVLLAMLLVGSYLTRGAMVNLPFLRGPGVGGPGGVRVGGASSTGALVDQRPWQTVEALAPLALSTEERDLAREAERLADHAVDQAFAMALRQASMEARVLTGDALALRQKVAGLQELVKEDQAKVDSLTASLKGPNGVVADSDDLDLAKAQLQLERDELSDTTDQLARVSGDKRGQIQQELAAREAAMKKFDERVEGGGQTAVASSKRFTTLAGRVSAWFDQRSRMSLIAEARARTDADVRALARQRGEMEQEREGSAAEVGAVSLAGAGAPPGAAGAANSSLDRAVGLDSGPGSGPGSVPSSDLNSIPVSAPRPAAGSIDRPDTVKGRVARMAEVHRVAQMHGIVEDRLNTERQLGAVYGRWLEQVRLQHKIVVHLILQSLTWIAFVVLFAALLVSGLHALLGRWRADRRSLQTMRTIVTLGIELVTLILVLLVIFGAPSQTPTILGLATAGLTVVFQDFILAFFGWFVLMGKNGIRAGDWVEINGVGGEVVEIGIFRTTLLETGNWTDKGHPTGRRVTFVNKYAIAGQYFNFSTSGQWMWDEISVNIPPGVDTNKTIEAIHNAVIKETEKDAGLAEQEWQRTTRQNGLSQFGAKPSVDMRPAASGIDIIVRYVTRAGERFEMRNRLYQAVIDLLHRPEAAAAALVESPTGTKQ